MDFFEESFRVRYSEADRNGLLRNDALFDTFQEAASRHAERLGCRFGAMGGLTWVLSRMRIDISRMPRLGGEFSIKTWPSGFRRLFAAREALFYDGEGELARLTSYWLLLDTAAMRPRRPEDALECSLPENGDLPRYFDLGGREPMGDCSRPMAAAVLDHEVDVNMHMNNARYVTRASDWLAREAGGAVSLESLSASYIQASPPGCVLETSGSLDGDGRFCIEIAGPDSGGGMLRRFTASGRIRRVQCQ